MYCIVIRPDVKVKQFFFLIFLKVLVMHNAPEVAAFFAMTVCIFFIVHRNLSKMLDILIAHMKLRIYLEYVRQTEFLYINCSLMYVKFQ